MSNPRRKDNWVYPRTCGGNLESGTFKSSQAGLSPHMRGKLDHIFDQMILDGSIPAHAGETLLHLACWLQPRVYPRTCGGNFAGVNRTKTTGGLSPHMRGKLLSLTRYMSLSGSIPAHAGETAIYPPFNKIAGVYPRTCGGNQCLHNFISHDLGLSPHMRGKPPGFLPWAVVIGSIPAHAGETSLRRSA